MMKKVSKMLLALISFCIVNISLAQKGVLVPVDELEPERAPNEFIFNCSRNLTLNGCNYVQNPGFQLNNTAGNYQAPFVNGWVNDWADSHGDVDLNDANNVNGLPTASPIAGINFASIGSGGLGFDEGLCSKIVQLTAGQKYAFSFFRAMDIGTFWTPSNRVNVKFRVLLIHCNNFSEAGDSYSMPTIPRKHQEIYCENLGNSTVPWQQAFVQFTADDNYNMIWIFPEITGNNNDYFVTHFAYPEIIKATDIQATVSQNNCNTTFAVIDNGCSVTNMHYEWYDPSNNLISTSSTFTINTTTAQAGIYTVKKKVSNPVQITCLPDPYLYEAVSQVEFYKDACKCSLVSNNLNITQAVTKFYGTNGINTIQTQNLQTCTVNNLCYNVNEYLGLNLSSSESIGNHWEFFFTNQNLQWSGFRYNTGDQFSQSIDGFFVINPYENGELEIRLSNTITGNSRSIFLRLQSYNINYWWQRITNTTYEYQITTQSSGNNPYNTYNWTFPSGMQADNLNTELPKFTFGSYNGSYPANATLLVTNQFCPSYTTTVPLQPGLRMAVSNTKHQITDLNIVNKNKLNIYPNPAKKEIRIEASKKIQSIIISTIEGKSIKQLSQSKNDLYASIDINFLPNGIYNVKIIYTDFTTVSKLIIKE